MVFTREHSSPTGQSQRPNLRTLDAQHAIAGPTCQPKTSLLRFSPSCRHSTVNSIDVFSFLRTEAVPLLSVDAVRAHDANLLPALDARHVRRPSHQTASTCRSTLANPSPRAIKPPIGRRPHQFPPAATTKPPRSSLPLLPASSPRCSAPPPQPPPFSNSPIGRRHQRSPPPRYSLLRSWPPWPLHWRAPHHRSRAEPSPHVTPLAASATPSSSPRHCRCSAPRQATSIGPEHRCSIHYRVASHAERLAEAKDASRASTRRHPRLAVPIGCSWTRPRSPPTSRDAGRCLAQHCDISTTICLRKPLENHDLVVPSSSVALLYLGRSCDALAKLAPSLDRAPTLSVAIIAAWINMTKPQS